MEHNQTRRCDACDNISFCVADEAYDDYGASYTDWSPDDCPLCGAQNFGNMIDVATPREDFHSDG